MADTHYMVKVEEILKTVTYSVDFGYVENYAGATEDDKRTAFWMDVINRKAADTGFGHLMESIMAHGWTSAIGWQNTDITEGHHRLVAAILLCEDEVPVTFWGTRDDVRDISGHGDYGKGPYGITDLF